MKVRVPAALMTQLISENLRTLPDPELLSGREGLRGREEEVTDGIMEHERSVVFDQAENRLHAQKGLLLTLLG